MTSIRVELPWSNCAVLSADTPFTVKDLVGKSRSVKRRGSRLATEVVSNVSGELKFPVESCPDESAEGKHVVWLWCLDAAAPYEAHVNAEGSETDVAVVPFKTKLPEFGDIPHFIVDRVHFGSPQFIECVRGQPTDWMLTLRSGKARDDLALIDRLYYEGLFTLPVTSQEAPLLSLPNGLQRYCIDVSALANGTAGPHRTWSHNKKMKKALRAGDLFLRINHDFRGSMIAAKEYHEQTNGGTWITEEMATLMAVHQRTTEQRPPSGPGGGRVRLLAIELVRGDGTVLATTLGFELGAVFHDFSMFTSVKSNEGFGTILTKIVGDSLERCGFDLWYWGFRVKYMGQFESGSTRRRFDAEKEESDEEQEEEQPAVQKPRPDDAKEAEDGANDDNNINNTGGSAGYGAVKIGRRDFYDRWVARRDGVPASGKDFTAFVTEGNAMVPLWKAQ